MQSARSEDSAISMEWNLLNLIQGISSPSPTCSRQATWAITAPEATGYCSRKMLLPAFRVPVKRRFLNSP
jgi:hypothetical protein